MPLHKSAEVYRLIHKSIEFWLPKKWTGLLFGWVSSWKQDWVMVLVSLRLKAHCEILDSLEVLSIWFVRFAQVLVTFRLVRFSLEQSYTHTCIFHASNSLSNWLGTWIPMDLVLPMDCAPGLRRPSRTDSGLHRIDLTILEFRFSFVTWYALCRLPIPIDICVFFCAFKRGSAAAYYFGFFFFFQPKKAAVAQASVCW